MRLLFSTEPAGHHPLFVRRADHAIPSISASPRPRQAQVKRCHTLFPPPNAPLPAGVPLLIKLACFSQCPAAPISTSGQLEHLPLPLPSSDRSSLSAPTVLKLLPSSHLAFRPPAWIDGPTFRLC